MTVWKEQSTMLKYSRCSRKNEYSFSASGTRYPAYRSRLLNDFPAVSEARITLDKQNPPMGADCKEVGVEATSAGNPAIYFPVSKEKAIFVPRSFIPNLTAMKEIN